MKRTLTKEQYDILYRKQTEPAFSGKYCHFDKEGTYLCAACGNPLFLSQYKFDSGQGWPSFRSSIAGHVRIMPNYRNGTPKNEVSCTNCHCYLGHILNEITAVCETEYSINSLALNFRQEIS